MPSILSMPTVRSPSGDSPLASCPQNSTTTMLNRLSSGTVGTPRAMSMVSRVQQRDDELRRSFDLPQGELFMDEFYCALHKKILLQGRMYVFENFVCFYSNLFGWVKKKVIPLSEVVEISKKRHYGFPNSIKIVWNGKSEFFTSFLSREDAYALLLNARNQAQLADPASDPDPWDNRGERVVSKRYEDPSRSETCSCDADSSEGSPSTRRTAEKQENSDSEKGHHTRSKSHGKVERRKGTTDDANDSDSEGYEDEDEWHIEDVEAPPVSSGMECIVEETFNTSVREFFNQILSNDSDYFEEFHKARGDQRYMGSPWQKHSFLCGSVRHTTFVSPVKSRVRVGLITPSKTDCMQNQRYCVYRGDHMVYETSQVMKDIPYGDYFKVEMRWDVKPLDNSLPGGEGCRLVIHSEVPFIRSVLAPIRRMIHTSVFREVQDSTEKMVSLLRETLADNLPSSTGESGEFSEHGDYAPLENFNDLLNRKDFRQWIIRTVQEEFGATPGDSLSVSSHRGRPRGSVDFDVLSNHGGRRKSFSSGRLLSWIWPIHAARGSQPMLLFIFVLVVFFFQLLNVLLWMFPRTSRCDGPDVHRIPSIVDTDRANVVGHLAQVHDDLQGLQQHLQGLVQLLRSG